MTREDYCIFFLISIDFLYTLVTIYPEPYLGIVICDFFFFCLYSLILTIPVLNSVGGI